MTDGVVQVVNAGLGRYNWKLVFVCWEIFPAAAASI